MNPMNTISFESLLIASSLALVPLFFSYWQALRLEKDILISLARAVIQLFIMGYILETIFGLQHPAFTTFVVLIMIANAAHTAAKHSASPKGKAFLISYVAILCGASLTLAILVASEIIHYVPHQIIPISGMVIGNAMTALGLCYKQLKGAFKDRREEVETKLALGADILPASIDIIRQSLKMGMTPTIDSAKTLGIVSLPGMMTGLILAGAAPLEAIKYQLMVTFMLLSTTALSSFIACYLSYRGFFNDRKQVLYVK